MISFNKFKKNLYQEHNLADRFVLEDCHVFITEDLQIIANDEYIGDAKSLEEARAYVRKYVKHKKIVETLNSLIPEEKVVSLIKQYHDIDKITSTLIETYIELASSNVFSIDPVITAIKENSSQLPGKLEYTLEDGTIVAISEKTHLRLSNLLEDKYQIVEYMQKCKQNFMHVIKELEE